jgi:hypothetical protein
MESPKRKTRGTDSAACPICGRAFPAAEIEAHAAECAARAFGEDRPQEEPEAAHPGSSSRRRRDRPARQARVPVSTSYDKHLPSARSRAVSRSAPASGRCWAVPGGEAAQLRGGAVIYAAELPEHLLGRVDAADDALALLAPEAVSFTNSRGALDKRKTVLIRRLSFSKGGASLSARRRSTGAACRRRSTSSSFIDPRWASAARPKKPRARRPSSSCR